ncbi:MAG TPA: YdeI/OmpD-associated family protein [Gaiellaceae bacterium]|nr:YdeI/OmpD-associated family protein [Gaiellaceae bacterium]
MVEFPTRAAWAKWLAQHEDDEDGAWLKFAKKGTGVTTVTYDEALEVALCHGWIDAQVKRLDETYYLQRFVPRRARSKWSKRNVEIAERLIRKRKMRPRGLAEVERAKADGRWDAAYDSPRTATVPEDFERALRRNKKARAFFATLSASNRYAILYRIQDAKRPETRARRIAQFVEMLERGETPH